MYKKLGFFSFQCDALDLVKNEEHPATRSCLIPLRLPASGPQKLRLETKMQKWWLMNHSNILTMHGTHTYWCPKLNFQPVEQINQVWIRASHTTPTSQLCKQATSLKQMHKVNNLSAMKQMKNLLSCTLEVHINRVLWEYLEYTRHGLIVLIEIYLSL